MRFNFSEVYCSDVYCNAVWFCQVCVIEVYSVTYSLMKSGLLRLSYVKFSLSEF